MKKAVTIPRKKEIQRAIKKKLKIVVDTPKQGAGNTNCGNTSRKFFKNYKVVAEVTGKF